jgi:hypothetical protein
MISFSRWSYPDNQSYLEQPYVAIKISEIIKNEAETRLRKLSEQKRKKWQKRKS